MGSTPECPMHNINQRSLNWNRPCNLATTLPIYAATQDMIWIYFWQNMKLLLTMNLVLWNSVTIYDFVTVLSCWLHSIKKLFVYCNQFYSWPITRIPYNLKVNVLIFLLNINCLIVVSEAEPGDSGWIKGEELVRLSTAAGVAFRAAYMCTPHMWQCCHTLLFSSHITLIMNHICWKHTYYGLYITW